MSATYPEDLGLLTFTDPYVVVLVLGGRRACTSLEYKSREPESFRANPRDRRLRDHLKRNSWLEMSSRLFSGASRPRLDLSLSKRFLAVIISLREYCAPLVKSEPTPIPPPLRPWTVPLFDAPLPSSQPSWRPKHRRWLHGVQMRTRCLISWRIVNARNYRRCGWITCHRHGEEGRKRRVVVARWWVISSSWQFNDNPGLPIPSTMDRCGTFIWRGKRARFFLLVVGDSVRDVYQSRGWGKGTSSRIDAWFITQCQCWMAVGAVPPRFVT